MGDINAVIKIGGSIVKNKMILRGVCDEINRLTNKGYKIVIIPGGGRLVEDVRKMYKKYDISEEIAHWMAIKAMDINGLLISNFNENFIVTSTIEDCLKELKKRKIPVFLVYKFLKEKDYLPKSWDVTSDSISLYFTHLLKAKYNILLKDVDGIYKNNNPDSIISKINVFRLRSLKYETCVDKYLSELLLKYNRAVHIISGFHPERIKQVLEGKTFGGTLITP